MSHLTSIIRGLVRESLGGRATQTAFIAPHGGQAETIRAEIDDVVGSLPRWLLELPRYSKSSDTFVFQDLGSIKIVRHPDSLRGLVLDRIYVFQDEDEVQAMFPMPTVEQIE